MKKKLLLPLAMAALLGLSACVQISFTPPGKSSSEPGKSSEPTSSVTPVEEGSVTGVTVSLKNEGDSTTITEGATLDLVANVVGEGTFDKTVTWSSSDSEIAAVNRATGRVTAKAPGTVLITATSTQDSTKSGLIEVTVSTKKDDIGSLQNGVEAIVYGVVDAISQRGFVLRDNTGSVQVYLNADPTAGENGLAIGDYIKVKGTPACTSRNAAGATQFDNKAEITKLTDAPQIDTSAAPLTVADLTAMKASLPAAPEGATSDEKKDFYDKYGPYFPANLVKKFSWRTTAGKSGNYDTFPLEGSDVVIEASYLPAAMSVVTGTIYDVEGYFVGYSYNNYASVVFSKIEKYVSEDLPESIALQDPKGAAEGNLTVGSDLRLSVVTTPAGANDSVRWETSDASIASVVDGVVHGEGVGTATISAFSTVTTLSATYTVHVKAAMNPGTADNPISVSYALEAGNDLATGAYAPEKVFVTGVVTAVGTYNSTYKNYTGMYIADPTDTSKKMQVYRATLAEGLTEHAVGDTVVVTGYLQNYNGTPQVTYQGNENPVILSITRGEGPVTPTPTGHGFELNDPFTPAELAAYIDGSSFDATATVYVSGTIKNGSFYENGSSSNWDMYFEAGDLTVQLFRAQNTANLADYLPENPVNKKATDAPKLVGATVVASGLATKYNSKYELNQGCKVESITAGTTPVGPVDPTPTTTTALGSLELNASVTVDVKVIAEAYNGFLVGDSSGVAYIFTKNYSGDNKTPAVGTHLTIVGDVAAYNGGLQVVPSAITVAEGDAPSVLAEVAMTEELGLALTAEAKTAKGSSTGLAANRNAIYTFENVAIGGSGNFMTWALGSANFETTSTADANKPVAGKNYDIKAIAFGYYNKDANSPEYLTMIVVSATEHSGGDTPVDPTPSGDIFDTAEAVSIASVKAATAEDNSKLVKVTGIAEHLYGQAKYGNFYLTDPTTKDSIIIYGGYTSGVTYETGSKGTVASDAVAVTSDILGKTVTVVGTVGAHNNLGQIVNGTVRVDNQTVQSGLAAAISVNDSAMGSASLSKTSGLAYGDEVTVTVTPANGYEVESVVVHAAWGDATITSSLKFNVSMVNNVEVKFKAASTVQPGDTVVVEFNAGTEVGSQTGQGTYSDVVTKNGVTITGNSTPLGNTDNYRIYKGKSFTISVNGTITSIVMTCTASGTEKYGPGCFAALEGYSYNGVTGTWAGSAASVSFTADTNQVRITKIVVTYTAA